VFLNMAGGVKIDEPAIDLAVCCSIVSSLLDKPVDNSIVVIGEVGLGGEIRSVGNIEKRIAEAEKLGFRKIIIPDNNLKSIKSEKSALIIPVKSMSDTISNIFE
jgi:DNA repair protein RadA/Sms